MNFCLSLQRVQLEPGTVWRATSGAGAFLVESGRILADGSELGTDEGGLIRGPVSAAEGDPAVLLVFLLSEEAPLDCLASQNIAASAPFLLRLDEVSFPPGAIAYRHVHPGPGFRHLRRGHLVLQADDHSFEASEGSTWFEPANSPVRATASSGAPETRFVRCMVLPPECQGKPTIRILDPTDAKRPKLQSTFRHVDHIVTRWDHVEAG